MKSLCLESMSKVSFLVLINIYQISFITHHLEGAIYFPIALANVSIYRHLDTNLATNFSHYSTDMVMSDEMVQWDWG